MTARLPDKPPMPRLWTLFAVAWLLLLVLVAWRLPTAGLTPAHLSGSVACVALLALAYVWLTIRQAPGAADLAVENVDARPEPAAVGALAVMAACVFVF